MPLRILDFLAKHAALALASGVFLGLAWPALAQALTPALVPAVFLMMVGALLRLDWSAVVAEIRRPARTAVVVLWVAGVIPLLTFGIVSQLTLPPPLMTAVVLMAASAPLITSVPLALLLGLDAALAIVVLVIAMLLLPFYLPPLALALLGLDLSIGLGTLMLRLGALVGGAILLALIIGRLAGRERLRAAAPRIDGVVVILMLIFVVAIMDGVTEALLDRPGFVLLYVATAFVANVGLQVLGTAAFLWMGREQALTCGLITGNRNLAILYAAMTGTGDFDVLLFFAVAQLPIYILPFVLQPIYRRVMSGP